MPGSRRRDHVDRRGPRSSSKVRLRGNASAGSARPQLCSKHLALASPSIGTLRSTGILAGPACPARSALVGIDPMFSWSPGADPVVLEHFQQRTQAQRPRPDHRTVGPVQATDFARDEHGAHAAAFTAGSAQPVAPTPDRPYDIVLVDDLLRDGPALTSVMSSLTQICRDRALVFFADATSAPWIEFCLGGATPGVPAKSTWQTAAAEAGLDVIRADAIAGGCILITRCRDGARRGPVELDATLGGGPWLILAEDSGFEGIMADALGATA